jgi:hypothetical protein
MTMLKVARPGKTRVRLDALAHIAQAVKPAQPDGPKGLAFANNRRQRTETGAGRVTTTTNAYAAMAVLHSWDADIVDDRSGLDDVRLGDYVLATKYEDGDPGDQWAVGWFTGMLPKGSMTDTTRWRFMVADQNGKQYRGNGFRRCERITHDQGVYICENQATLSAMVGQFYYDDDGSKQGLSVWDFLAQYPHSVANSSSAK